MQRTATTEVSMTAAKPEYERPKITSYGELTELTEGTNHGNTFDSNFHVGQPFTPNILSCRGAGCPGAVTLP